MEVVHCSTAKPALDEVCIFIQHCIVFHWGLIGRFQLDGISAPLIKFMNLCDASCDFTCDLFQGNCVEGRGSFLGLEPLNWHVRCSAGELILNV